MTRFQLSVALSLAAWVGAANADLINISTTGFQSSVEPQIACTIVGNTPPFFQGAKALVVFSESVRNGANTRLLVQYLNTDFVVTNSDWRSPMTLNGELFDLEAPELVYAELLRTPGRSTDAAVLTVAYPGQRVCAFSYEETGSNSLVSASVSITDVTSVVTAQSDSGEKRKMAEFLDRWHEAQGLAR